jgi:YHS domain-containing protein
MIRLAVFVLLVIVAYKLLSGLLKKFGVSDKKEVPGHRIAADLVQDPQCGAYILPAQGVSARVGGKTFHFCSEGCKDKFLLEHSEKKNDKTD